MIATLLAVSATIVVTWFYLKWRKLKNFWADRNVPHDAPHPIYGSLRFLQKQNPAIWMRKLYDTFKTPYIGIWVFWRPGLIVNSPELARKILVRDTDNFRNRFLSSGETDPIGALNIFTLNDPTWTIIRKRLTSVFTSAKLKTLQVLTKQKANDLILRIEEEMKRPLREDFSLRSLFSDFTTDVIGEAAFGIKSEAARTGDSVIRKVTRDFMHFSIFRGLCWSSIFFYPELVDIFRFSFFPKDTGEFLKKIFRKVIEQRGGLDAVPKEQRDLLDALLILRHEAKLENEDITEDMLLAQAAIFLQAGFDTSGAALAYLIYELAHNSEVQEKLHRELMDAKQQLGTADFDSTHLSEMNYLNAIIKETVRKYPAMGWLDRIAAQDYKLDDKLTIPAGTVVYVNAYGMHMDPEHFPEPDVFDPERFMPENERNIKPYSYMPFGDGPRNCIGMRFAQQSMRFMVAAVCMKFRLESLPNTPKPNDCKVEKKGLFLMPDEGMPIKFITRDYQNDRDAPSCFCNIVVPWFYLKWRKLKNFWADRNVPHDAPHPIYGSLSFLQKQNPAMWMRKLYDTFKTPYIGIWVFWRPGLIVNSPELARKILVRDTDNFRNRFLSSGETDPIGALNIFTLNDPTWTTIRKRLTSVFTSAKLKTLQGLTKQKANDLILRIEEEMKGPIREDFNLRTLFSDYTTDVIGEAAFGIKSEAARTGDSVIRKVTRDFMHFSIFRGLSWSSIFFFPELVDIFRFSFFPKDTGEFLRNIFRKVIDPFGDGPRNCIGMRFAQQTMRFMVATVCMKFRLESLPNTPKPNDCKIEKKGFFLMPDERMPIKFITRD